MVEVKGYGVVHQRGSSGGVRVGGQGVMEVKGWGDGKLWGQGGMVVGVGVVGVKGWGGGV